MQKRYVWSYGLAVEVKSYCALRVGAVGFYTGLLSSLQDFVPGMSVHISRADGNDGIAGMNGAEQIGRGSARASVVRDLQQHCLRMLFHDAAFRWTLRVAFKQSGRAGESRGENQAIIVCAHRAGDLVASGSEHLEVRSAEIEFVAVFFYGYFHARLLSLLDDRQQLACGHIYSPRVLGGGNLQVPRACRRGGRHEDA